MKKSTGQSIITWSSIVFCLCVFAGAAYLVGEGLVSFAVEMVLAVIFLGILSAAIAGSVLVVPFIVSKARMRSALLRIFVVLTLIVFVFFLGGHFNMSMKLKPLKKQFYKVAYDENQVELVRHVDGFTLDYDGVLDAILDDRDELIEKHNFRGFGNWWATDSIIRVFMVYVFNPFQKKESKP